MSIVSHAGLVRAYALYMRDPDEGGAQQPAETLQASPTRFSLFEVVLSKWRQPARSFLAFLLGVAVGGGAMLWWQARPAPPALRADEHAVELVLFDAGSPRTRPGAATSDVSPLQVDGGLLLSGGTTSTVLEIGALGRSLDVNAPALPVTVSPTGRYRSVDLRIIVRDCKLATRWQAGDRPFTLRWRDEYGEGHLDRAGDFGRSVAVSLIRYIDAVCEDPLNW